jgi:hypothetical protein
MGRQTQLFKGYEFPTTNTQEVLLTLILQGYVSLFDFPTLSGFRTRISELNNKHGLLIGTETVKRNNKFGNMMKYSLHKLPPEEKDNAILLYKKLNKNYKNQ